MNASSTVKDDYHVAYLQRTVTGVWSFFFSVAVRLSVRTLPYTIGWWLQCQMFIVWRLWGVKIKASEDWFIPVPSSPYEGDHLLPGQACFWARRCHVWVCSVWNNFLDTGFSNVPV